jgi:hypothetical protein
MKDYAVALRQEVQPSGTFVFEEYVSARSGKHHGQRSGKRVAKSGQDVDSVNIVLTV